MELSKKKLKSENRQARIKLHCRTDRKARLTEASKADHKGQHFVYRFCGFVNQLIFQ